MVHEDVANVAGGQFLRVDVDAAGTPVIVALGGELDLASAPTLGAALDDVLAQGCRDLVIDLGALEFLDCAGLRVLTAAADRLRAAGGEMAMRAPRPNVWRVFELTGVSDEISVEASR